MPKTTSPIQSDFFKREQSWHLHEISTIGDRKVRVRIRRNAYDEQSHALVEVWTGNEWSKVVERDITFMSCKTVSYVDPDHKKPANLVLFQKDAAALRELARAVLI